MPPTGHFSTAINTSAKPLFRGSEKKARFSAAPKRSLATHPYDGRGKVLEKRANLPGQSQPAGDREIVDCLARLAVWSEPVSRTMIANSGRKNNGSEAYFARQLSAAEQKTPDYRAYCLVCPVNNWLHKWSVQMAIGGVAAQFNGYGHPGTAG